jgi:phospholipase C
MSQPDVDGNGVDAGHASDASPPGTDANVDAAIVLEDAYVVPVPDAGGCQLTLPADTHTADRHACTFDIGAHTTTTLGITPAQGAQIPIDHIVIVTQENRSFDHYFATWDGDLTDPLPASYRNNDDAGHSVAPHHLTSHCLEADPGHQWTNMHNGWHNGAMDGWVRNADTTTSDGHYAMGYYTAADHPFYHWLSHTFGFSDQHFGDSLGGTWSNRAFLYTGSSHGVHSTGEMTIPSARTIYDALDDAHVTWGVYSSSGIRQDVLGWTTSHAGVHNFNTFLAQLADGSLPAVSYVDPAGGEDEHPVRDIGGGEQWVRRIYEGAIASPLWGSIAIFVTYDESGGLFDHVNPPAACLPDPTLTEFDRYGVRVPLYVISPWARPSFVGHVANSHTSIVRFVELRFGLPALSARDANSNAMLEYFDFCQPSFPTGPAAPMGFGLSGC